jgi:dolichol-phosphate mannosyltransferase
VNPDVPKVSVVLPTFNEKDNIKSLIDELRQRFGSKGYSYEIIVVDDASPDNTAEVVRESFGSDTRIKLIVRHENRGLANSIRDGIRSSLGSIILVMDADFNHKPSDAVLLFEIAQHVDIAVGSRFAFGGGMPSSLRYYFSFFYNIFLRILLGTRMDDNLTGLFAIKRQRMLQLDAEKIFWGYGDYYFRLLLLSQRERFLHVQLPIFYGERLRGQSKTRFFQIFLDYTLAALRIFYLKARKQW